MYLAEFRHDYLATKRFAGRYPAPSLLYGRRLHLRVNISLHLDTRSAQIMEAFTGAHVEDEYKDYDQAFLRLSY